MMTYAARLLICIILSPLAAGVSSLVQESSRLRMRNGSNTGMIAGMDMAVCGHWELLDYCGTLDRLQLAHGCPGRLQALAVMRTKEHHPDLELRTSQHHLPYSKLRPRANANYKPI